MNKILSYVALTAVFFASHAMTAPESGVIDQTIALIKR